MSTIIQPLSLFSYFKDLQNPSGFFKCPGYWCAYDLVDLISEKFSDTGGERYYALRDGALKSRPSFSFEEGFTPSKRPDVYLRVDPVTSEEAANFSVCYTERYFYKGKKGQHVNCTISQRFFCDEKTGKFQISDLKCRVSNFSENKDLCAAFKTYSKTQEAVNLRNHFLNLWKNLAQQISSNCKEENKVSNLNAEAKPYTPSMGYESSILFANLKYEEEATCLEQELSPWQQPCGDTSNLEPIQFLSLWDADRSLKQEQMPWCSYPKSVTAVKIG